MKVFKITLIIIFLSILINEVRQGDNYPILQTLPLLGGYRPLKYQVASIVVLCMAAWGCYRLRKNRRKAKQKQNFTMPIPGQRNQFGSPQYNYRYFRYLK